jgi:nicotinamidase-related amidase
VNQPDVSKHPEKELEIGLSHEETHGPWLVIIDPQVIFADPDSRWGAPEFDQALANIKRLAPHFGDRIVVTRWIPTADRSTSWGPYFETFPFADEPEDHRLFDLVGEIGEDLLVRPTVNRPTFGKWGTELAEVLGTSVGEDGLIVLTGVSTDCCVVSTALAAADAGVQVNLARDACADSTPENGGTAVQLMELYKPQIRMTSTDEVLEKLV